MNNINNLRVCNALYSSLCIYPKAQVLKNLSSGVNYRQTIMGQQKAPILLKYGFFYPSMNSSKIHMNLKCGDIFNVSRTYSTRHTNLSFSKTSSLYDVLGVPPNAKASDIKSAFYSLSKTYHPDINKTEEAAAKFAQILSAYEILGNQTKRRMYDRGAMMHPRFGVSPHREHQPSDYSKRPMKPGGVGRRPDGAGPQRDFTDASGRPAFKFEADFHDYYYASRDNRLFTKRESEFFMKRHHEDEKNRRFRGIATGFLVFTFIGLAFLSKIFDYRHQKNRTSFSQSKD